MSWQTEVLCVALVYGPWSQAMLSLKKAFKVSPPLLASNPFSSRAAHEIKPNPAIPGTSMTSAWSYPWANVQLSPYGHMPVCMNLSQRRVLDARTACVTVMQSVSTSGTCSIMLETITAVQSGTSVPAPCACPGHCWLQQSCHHHHHHHPPC